MTSVVRHRFTLALGAALMLSGCTVSDVKDKTPAADTGVAVSARAPAPGQPAAGSTTGAATTTDAPNPATLGTAAGAAPPAGAAASGSAAPGAAGSNMSPDSVDIGHTVKSDSMPASGMRLEVNLATRTLTVFDHERQIATHRVAVGSKEWPTKTGDWNVTQVVWNPEWIPPDETWAEQRTPRKPGAPDNPLGRAQLVYDPPRTIHGTNEPGSIGKAVSHGSIRLPNSVITQLGRQLMEATGAGKDDAWYARVQQNRTEKVVVDLPQRVPIHVY